MIDPDKRKAIYLLHKEGMGTGSIARQLKVARNTVSSIIALKGEIPESTRKDKLVLDPELLRRLYAECEGWVQRIYEKLVEEEGIKVGYSTLTRQIRELDLGGRSKSRCDQKPDLPGEEMQHDTSPYQLKVGGRRILVVGSMLYFRYCKIRYLKFYRSFNRFRMKCFFHEALSFWKYVALFCIIDNTNLARLRGTGKNAVIVPEMKQFSESYGFKFICHEKGHANRKAGNERSFYTVETNFFPGRTFESMEDLNRKALEWATVRMVNRPVAKTGLIPSKAFEHEQSWLKKIPSFVGPPYLVHTRGTDQYGYISLDGNYYWVPGTSRQEMTVLQYSTSLKIYFKRKLLAQYSLPPEGTLNEKFSPNGCPPPRYQPKYRKKPTANEEAELRAVSPEVDAYLSFAIKELGTKKHGFLRRLYALYKKLALPLFIDTLRRAQKYRILDMETIERISILMMNQGESRLPFVDVDETFQEREAYLEGRFSGRVDLSVYEKLLDDDDDEDDNG